MADISDKARDLLKTAETHRRRHEYDAAATALEQAVAHLEAALPQDKSAPASSEEKQIAAEIADVYGRIGGTRKQQGDLAAAAAAYDAGFSYESNPRYGFANSYNALNRLVTRVLLSPACLSNPDAVDVPVALRRLQDELKRQIRSVRATDYWALGDLALISALIGDEQETNNALEKFAANSPPRHAYEAYLESITALARLDTPVKLSLQNAESWLRSR